MSGLPCIECGATDSCNCGMDPGPDLSLCAGCARTLTSIFAEVKAGELYVPVCSEGCKDAVMAPRDDARRIAHALLFQASAWGREGTS